jgi:DNA-binding FadR family transcriptional regulator
MKSGRNALGGEMTEEPVVSGSFQELALKRTAPEIDDLAADHVNVPKAASVIAHKLRAQIIRGELGEEDTLPSEAVLVDRFNVSRQTLREAFRVLESENLIAIRRGSRGGAKVLVPDGEMAALHVGFLLEFRGATLLDVYNTREMVEAGAVRMVVENRDRADIAALRQRQSELEDLSLPEPMRFAHNSLTFHQLIVELTRSHTLAVFDGVINRIIMHAYESVTRELIQKGTIPSRNAASHHDHGELIQLIEEGDAEAAERHWREHCRASADASLSEDARTSVLELLGD